MPDSNITAQRLLPEQLTRTFNGHFNFTSTAELEPLSGVLGQERALEALQFGIAMQRPGYNVFIMGESGTGRFSYARRYLTEQAKLRPTPSDWLYVNHFTEMREPHALQLHRARAVVFVQISAPCWITCWQLSLQYLKPLLGSKRKAPLIVRLIAAMTKPWMWLKR